MHKHLKKLSTICTFSLIFLGAVAYGSNTSAPLNITPQLSSSTANELVFQLPDGRVVVKKPHEAPYCETTGTCDFPIDCYGNEPAPPKGQMWECKNAPGACVGQCYLQPITSKQEAQQKILATVVSGG